MKNGGSEGVAEPGNNGAFYTRAHPNPLRPPRENTCLRRVLMFLGFLITLAGIAVLITWLAIKPSAPEVYVLNGSGSLSNLDGSSSLSNQSASDVSVKIELRMSFRNPSKGVEYQYGGFFGSVYYDGFRTGGLVFLDSFYQPHKTTTNLEFAFNSDAITFSLGERTLLSSAASKGFLSPVNVHVWSGIRMTGAGMKNRHTILEVWCDSLWIPLNSSSPFTSKKCVVDSDS